MAYTTECNYWVEKSVSEIEKMDGVVFEKYQKLCSTFRVAFLHNPTPDVKELCEKLAVAAQETMLSGASFQEMRIANPQAIRNLFNVLQDIEDAHLADFYIFDCFIEEHFYATKEYEKMGFKEMNSLSAICTIFYYLKEWLGLGEDGDLFKDERKRIDALEEIYEEAGFELDALKDFDYGLDDGFNDEKEHDLGVRDLIPDYMLERNWGGIYPN